MAGETNKETQNKTSDQSSGTANKVTKENSSEASGATVDTEAIKDTAKGLFDQAKSSAGQAYGIAAEKATAKIDEKKSDLASGLSNVADTIRQIGGNLRDTDENTGITNTAAQYGDNLAKQVESLSAYFERNDVREMIKDLESFARRNPAVFIGGAVALGLLAARFLKSSPSGASSRRTGQLGKTEPQGLLGSGTQENTNKNNSQTSTASSKLKNENASNLGSDAVPSPS